MRCVIIADPQKDKSKFEFDYYEKRYVRLAADAMGDRGVNMEVRKGFASIDGSAAPAPFDCAYESEDRTGPADLAHSFQPCPYGRRRISMRWPPKGLGRGCVRRADYTNRQHQRHCRRDWRKEPRAR